MHTRIVILSRHSLLIEGIATRLRQMPDRVEVFFVDPEQDDYIRQITTSQPKVILMDDFYSKNRERNLLGELLIALPNIMLLRLTVDQTSVQVVTSQKRCFLETQDLIHFLTPPQTSSL